MSGTTSTTLHIERWLAHIRSLAVEIGPRGPTTPGEKQAAAYARAQFNRFGLTPVWEEFKSARSIFHPHLLGGALMLIAFILYPLAGRLSAVVAALLSLLVLVSELQELGFRDNLFRRLMPKGQSQNVFAVIPPSGEHRQDLVLVGHLDSQRTPLIFRSPAWVKAYGNFVTLVFITFILQIVLYSLGVFFAWGWLWYASIPTAVCSLLLMLLCLEAESTPFTAGANDNASGAGMLLTLAEALSAQPLQHTRVYAVCTGCEEVQHYGMIDFYQRHRAELVNPRALVFEMLGCAGPGWLTREGIIVPFKSDPGLVKVMEELSAAHQLGGYPVTINGGNSELADAIRYKVPAITLFGLKPDGEAPYWHQIHDTFDKMDPRVMAKTWSLSWAFIKQIDD